MEAKKKIMTGPLRKRVVRLFYASAAVAALCIASPVYGSNLGTALLDAMKSRDTCSVEKVRQKFLVAASQVAMPSRKAPILSLLADYLMEKGQWESAIEAFDEILRVGSPPEKAPALYGKATALLRLNQPERAREACILLKRDCPQNTMEDFAVSMKAMAPLCIHARLADILAGISLADRDGEPLPLAKEEASPGEPQPSEAAPRSLPRKDLTFEAVALSRMAKRKRKWDEFQGRKK